MTAVVVDLIISYLLLNLLLIAGYLVLFYGAGEAH